jgi:hypothetical protein
MRKCGVYGCICVTVQGVYKECDLYNNLTTNPLDKFISLVSNRGSKIHFNFLLFLHCFLQTIGAQILEEKLNNNVMATALAILPSQFSASADKRSLSRDKAVL